MAALPIRAVDDAQCSTTVSRERILREQVSRFPLIPPVEMAKELENHGYKGQAQQRATLSLMAYRHVRRLKRIYQDGRRRDSLPSKQNLLLVGPTGCGKTYLVEMLFKQLLGLPAIVLDATTFTERGYVGDDVSTIMTRLFETAGGNSLLAECGVVCLDEFDKLASSSSNARFAGQGTTKDVSGHGVQRELLTMIEGTCVSVPLDYGFSSHGPRIDISTRDMPFIACGAFSGLDGVRSQAGKRIGFRSAEAHDSFDHQNMPEVTAFQRYGFIPELIGRFTQTVFFPALDRQTLKAILLKNILPRFENEFRDEGILLHVTDDAVNHIVRLADSRATGARGLQTELVGILEQTAFEMFMQHKTAALTIGIEEGNLICIRSNCRMRSMASISRQLEN